MGSRAAGIVLSLGTGILVARALGPEGKGSLAYLSTLSSLLVRLASFGLEGSFAQFYLARRQPLADCLGTLVLSTLALGAVAATIAIGAVAIVPSVAAAGPSFGVVLAYAAATPAYLLLFLTSFLFFALRRELWFGAFDVAYRGSQLVLLALALMVCGGGVRVAAIVQLFISVGFAGVGLALVSRAAGWRWQWRAGLAGQMLTYGARYYGYSVARYVLCYGGVAYSAWLLGSREAGLFSVALMLAEVVVLFAGSVNLAFYPSVSDTSDAWRYAYRVSWRMLAASGLLALALAATAGVIIPIIYGPEFRPAVTAFIWMIPGVVPFAAEQVVSSYFASRGMPWRVIVILGAGAMVSALLAVVLGRPFGLVGLSLSSAGGQAFVAVLVGIEFFRQPRQSPLRDPVAAAVVLNDDTPEIV